MGPSNDTDKRTISSGSFWLHFPLWRHHNVIFSDDVILNVIFDNSKSSIRYSHWDHPIRLGAVPIQLVTLEKIVGHIIENILRWGESPHEKSRQLFHTYFFVLTHNSFHSLKNTQKIENFSKMPKNWENRLSELRALTAAIRDRNRLKYRLTQNFWPKVPIK